MSSAIHSSIAIITVTYNSARALPALLASIKVSAPASTHVSTRHIVVDNNSTDNSVTLAKAASAEVIASSENLGFARGCNVGAAHAAAQQADLLFFLNPDCVLHDGCLQALSAAAATYPDAVAFTPLTYKSNGVPLFSFRSLLSPYLPNPHNIKRWPQGDCCIPMASGGALCVRRSAFEKAGGFDEKIFMFFEDDDLCARLIKQGGAIVHVQGAAITHHVGTGTRRSWQSLIFKNRKFAEGKIYIHQKYGLPLPRAWLRLRALLGMLRGLLSGSPTRLAKYYGRWQGLRAKGFSG